MPRGRPRKNQDVLFRSAELIGWALGGLEREILQTRERLTSLTAQAAKLRTQLGRPAQESGTAAGAATGAQADAEPTGRRGRRRRRRMSPEARKRISEMMKKRWAERRKRNA
jgi:hypothetical protein